MAKESAHHEDAYTINGSRKPQEDSNAGRGALAEGEHVFQGGVGQARSRLGQFIGSFGPAWIVMIADVDAASVLTAAQDGLAYGYGLIWFLVLLIVPLFVIQEAAGRIGVATGKGLGDVIRENYSKRVAIAMSLPMALTDVLSYVAEFTGIAIGFALLGVPPVMSLPVAYLLHLVVVWKRRYITAEKILLAISVVLMISYAGSLLVRGVPAYSNLTFFFPSSEPKFLYLLAASAGAVVMPFMLFYQASATAEKETRLVWTSRLETLLGAIASEALMVVILLASVGLDSGTKLSSPSSLSLALSFVAGRYAPYLFGIGLISAAFLALVVISLASAWAVVEAVGLGRSNFFWIYLVESLPAVVVPMFFPDLFSLILNLMVAFVFVLVGPGIMVGLVACNKKVMGSYASTNLWKISYWSGLAFVAAFGVVAVAVM